MRPLDQRTDQTFTQALKCVEFRLPTRLELKPEPFRLSLGMRYGLIGAAAAHHLLVWCPQGEEDALSGYLKRYGHLVDDHVAHDICSRLGGWDVAKDPMFPVRVGQHARELVMAYLPLYRRACPLELGLSLIAEEFTAAHPAEIRAGSGWFGKLKAARQFQIACDQSYAFALYFFERRQAGVDEVPEIALIGE